ncbi:MAG TPA: sulfotransferase [Candidatus Obscuribacterales bacterium]
MEKFLRIQPGGGLNKWRKLLDGLSRGYSPMLNLSLPESINRAINGALGRLGLKFDNASATLINELRGHLAHLEKKNRDLEERLRISQHAECAHKAELRRFLRLQRKELVAVRQPLVLISQIQRSGGTLLSQLLDNHPQCHAHPDELYIGHPKKYVWPDLNVALSPKELFERLKERHAAQAFYEGYGKPANDRIDDFDKFPFCLIPSLQEQIFLECMSSLDKPSERDVLNAYMTSYFNAWLDNKNLYGDKKYVTAFVPRMHMYEGNLEGFYRVYPDGRLISIVRDPRSWYVSARKHKPHRYGKIEEGIALWKESTAAAIAAKNLYADRVYLVEFEGLVNSTETVMRSIAQYLDITFSDTLLQPTFNGQPIRADSVFPVQTFGIIREPAARHETHLTNAEREYIARETASLYNKAKELIALQSGLPSAISSPCQAAAQIHEQAIR